MRTRYALIFSLIFLSLIGSSGIVAAESGNSSANGTGSTAPDFGVIGPGHALYGLRIAFENFDESFTVNQTEKLEKQVMHADLRLSELAKELEGNRTDLANIAMEQYWQKLNQTDMALDMLSRNNSVPGGNDTGLVQAREMITKHQQVLEGLLESHPDNKGLARAYNNSLALEEKFTERVETHNRFRPPAGNNSALPDDSTGSRQNQTLREQRPGPDGNQTALRDGNMSRDMNGMMGNLSRDLPPVTERNQSSGMKDYGQNQTDRDPHKNAGNDKAGQGSTAGNERNAGNNQSGDYRDSTDNANQNPGNNNDMNTARDGGRQDSGRNNKPEEEGGNDNGIIKGNARAQGR